MPPFMIALMNMQIEMFCQFVTITKKMLDVSVSMPAQSAPTLKPVPVVTPLPVRLKKAGCVGPADLRS